MANVGAEVGSERIFQVIKQGGDGACEDKRERAYIREDSAERKGEETTKFEQK